MKFGLHISAAGSIAAAPERAQAKGCEVFQFFSRSPRGGPAPAITDLVIDKFKSDSKKWGLESYVHTPYFINLGAEKKNVKYGSIKVIREDLERASLLGCKYVMTHLGTARFLGEAKATAQTIESIQKILDGYIGTTQFLIEMSAGAGQVLGDTIEDVAAYIKGVEKDKRYKDMVGVCFDTCHAYASGYDLRTEAKIKKVFNKFDRLIGLDKLKLIHANDSRGELGQHKDRHEHISQGEIGLAGFKAMVNHPKLKHINMILETPDDGKEIDDLKLLKKLRTNK
ncbi:MAG: deoxyribonuclease IV [Patescibacteria group bacterium]